MQRGIKPILIHGAEWLRSIAKTTSPRGLVASAGEKGRQAEQGSAARAEKPKKRRAGVPLAPSEGTDHIDTEAAAYLFKLRQTV